MGLLNIIRRMALREKLPLREIARRTGMSRNTVKKYLNAGTIEPQFATPERNVSTTLRQWRLNFKLGFTPFALVG